jgi:hypothetical protein
MDITRDVFLTDGRAPYFTLTLASRDLHAHSIMTNLTAEEHDRIAEALSAAAGTVSEVLRDAHMREVDHAGATSFGCGT